MPNPIDYAMMVLKQWDDVNWEQPEAVGQYSDNPEIEQMLQPWPEGTNTGWQRGPPQNGEQGPVLSAEEARQRDIQRQQQTRPFSSRAEELSQVEPSGWLQQGGIPGTWGASAQVQPPVNQQYQPPAPTE